MHNGLRIRPGSYYGYPVTRQLRLTRGVGEPQEVRAFHEVLKYMPPGAAMVELGAYWAFYSMWFQQAVKNARGYLVEPTDCGIEAGILNFRLNNMFGTFEQAYVGAATGI